MTIGLSVSRVGSAAQTKAMKKVAGTLRLDLAQFRELAAFAQFGQDLDAATAKKIERGRRLTELLKQPQYHSIPFEEQVVSIYAVTKSFADNVKVSDIPAFEAGLVKFIKERQSAILTGLREKGEITSEIDASLSAACKDFSENYFKV